MVTATDHPMSVLQNYDALNTQDTADTIDNYAVSVLFQWITYAIVSQAIDIFGTVSNIINIICFVKQGFRDSVNVSLLGLAISDLGCLVTLAWINLTLTPAFQHADLPFDTLEVSYLTTGWPHIIFTRVTSCITALITVERCLCIIAPLKVKNIITPKRVMITIVCFFTVLTCTVSPVYSVYSVAPKFDPLRNKTILGLVSTDDRDIVEKVSFAINNVFIPFTSFIIVLFCTTLLVFELKKKNKWRRSATVNANNVSSSKRDQKVASMIVMISLLFIICFIPAVMTFVAVMMEPEFAVDGKFKNIFVMVFGLVFTLESTNSSMNIFIYYNMSSKYKAVFRQLFYKPEDDKQILVSIELEPRTVSNS